MLMNALSSVTRTFYYNSVECNCSSKFFFLCMYAEPFSNVVHGVLRRMEATVCCVKILLSRVSNSVEFLSSVQKFDV